MSCQRELKKVQLAAPEPPEIPAEMKNDPVYRTGFIYGFQAAIREAIEIAIEEHEEDENDG